MYDSYSKDGALPNVNAKLNIHESYELPSGTINYPERDASSLTYDNRNLYKSRNSYEIYDSNSSYTRENDEVSNLSSFTRLRNYIGRSDIDRFNKKHNDTTLTLDRNKDFAGNLLQSATREIRCLTYKLSTVVSDGNYHQILEPSTVVNVEVIEDMMIYCKIPAKFGYSPLKVKINYLTKNDVKIYISTKYKMPDASNCDQEYVKPRIIRVWAEGREKKFAGKLFYITL